MLISSWLVLLLYLQCLSNRSIVLVIYVDVTLTQGIRESYINDLFLRMLVFKEFHPPNSIQEFMASGLT